MGVLASLAWAAAPPASARSAPAQRFTAPASARQLIVLSSPSYAPRNHEATLRTFQRTRASSPWHAVSGPWPAEIGAGELVDVRHEGDHATPTGVYPIAATMYGIRRNPGGLHEPYHRLVCGDWWDEDPYSSQYNRFVHVACDTTPAFAEWSEALWTETCAYPYFAVIEYNEDPTRSGAGAPGSGIFLHAWMGEPTEGCVALPLPRLLDVLRWLEPAERPAIAIGTGAELAALPPA